MKNPFSVAEQAKASAEPIDLSYTDSDEMSDSSEALLQVIKMVHQSTPELWALQGASNISSYLMTSGVKNCSIHCAVWLAACPRVALDTVKSSFGPNVYMLTKQLRDFWSKSHVHLRVEDGEGMHELAKLAALADLVTVKASYPKASVNSDLVDLFLGINEKLDMDWDSVKKAGFEVKDGE